MKKILISWIAHNNDFDKERREVAKEEGPTYTFHKHFYDEKYEKHILLYGNEKDEINTLKLTTEIIKDFRHSISPICLHVNDVIDIGNIYPKVLNKLIEFEEYEIDIFFSPGTSAMQVCWYIAHSSNQFKTRLLQTRAAKHTQNKIKPELIIIKTDTSPEVFSTAVWQESISKQQRGKLTPDFLITDSIRNIYQNASKIALTDQVTAIIYGESGTGKEHLAKFIHDNSARKSKPFTPVNCSALRDELLESRLFGHKKGAFTGAENDHKGLLEETNGGTIFLDEIGDISQQMQQSLLRVLQEGEIQPIGGKTKKVNLRVIVATHRNLYELCKKGEFRWDLFYRLNVAELILPNLQKRGRSEITKLLEYFLRRKKTDLKKKKLLKLSAQVREHITSYPFPGNVRELENLIERLYVFCDENVECEDLPERIRKPDHEKSLLMKDLEKRHIEYVLKINNGNQNQTAKDLGIVINTLRSKLKQYSIIN
jgi:transcriptional regulator with PAS, ATPase and Fis domain